VFKRNDLFFYAMAITIGATVGYLLPNWFRQGTLVLSPTACSLVKSAGASPVETATNCTLEAKYSIGRNFTEVRIPNKKLLIGNAEIIGSIEK
jgi:hypothetical protein